MRTAISFSFKNFLPYGRNLAANSLFSGALTYSTGWNEESCAVKA
jgi:hypothetical protein